MIDRFYLRRGELPKIKQHKLGFVKQGVLTLILGFSLLQAPVIWGQEDDVSDDKTPEEIEVEKAENLKKIAEAELAVAKAKKELDDLDLPETETKGVEGTITTGDNVGFYAEMLAIMALSQATDSIAGEISGEIKGTQVIVSSNFELSDQLSLWNILDTRTKVMMSQLESLKNEYTDSGGNPYLPIQLESAMAALAAAPAVLGAITDIAKFFKTDREIKSANVEITNNALIAASAESLKKHVENVNITLLKFDLKTTGKLIQDIHELLDKNVEVTQWKGRVKDKIQDTLDDLSDQRKAISAKKAEIAKEKDANKKQQLEGELSELEADLAVSEQIETAWNNAASRFDKVIAATIEFIDGVFDRPKDGQSLAEMITTIDILKAHADANLLFVELSSKGGEYETSKGSLFTKPKISYLGGVAVTYMLIDKDGNYLASGIVPLTKGAEFKKLSDHAN